MLIEACVQRALKINWADATEYPLVGVESWDFSHDAEGRLGPDPRVNRDPRHCLYDPPHEPSRGCETDVLLGAQLKADVLQGLGQLPVLHSLRCEAHVSGTSAEQPVAHRLRHMTVDSDWDHYDRAWQITALRNKKRTCQHVHEYVCIR